MEVTLSWREAALQEGLQQGVQEGVQQGLRQGKHEGMLLVITHQIERRFGSLGSATRQRIEQLNVDQLERLGEVLLDFTRSEDLDNWLESA